MANEQIEIPVIIGGREIRTGDTEQVVMPHDHAHVLGVWHKARSEDVREAVQVALDARAEWASWHWYDRVAVFLRAAELLATTWRPGAQCRHHARPGQDRSPGGDRQRLRADRLLALQRRFYPAAALGTAPVGAGRLEPARASAARGVHLRRHTPFNFTAIAGNLPTAPAMLGNVAIWKPLPRPSTVATTS